jgi:hypothetical protein
MGQAAVDLPDPLEPTETSDDANASSTTAVAAPAPAPVEGADDLLAQLAGEEIDRLLAEADVEPAPPKRDASEPDQAIPPAKAVATPPADLGAVLDNASKTAAEPVETSAPAGAVEADNLSVAERELDALLSDTPAAPAVAPVAPKEEQTTAVESAALLGSTASAAPGGRQTDDDGAEPFLVRVLEWMNAPFAALSDRARDTIGMLAVLTFFNALAVLLYVLMFRRH